MERSIQKVKFRFLKRALIIFMIMGCGIFYAQTPSVIKNIRIPLWAELDAYPGLQEAEEVDSGQYDFPVKQMRTIAPFIINGMVYGWNFIYVPSDKARGVEELLEVTEIVSSEVIKGGIKYSSPWITEGKLNCWVEYSRTDSQVQSYNLWNSIKNPVIGGTGYASVEKGFEGIEEAAREALKNAIRNYYRKIIKNKPKEINGSVLIRSFPTLGIDSGRYVIKLDFFLECGKIIEYSVY